ncbi:hypothetical protein FHX40_2724 [Thermopolyspora flexuosa]|jgi:hypothetical protein|uniref:Uncharacterized protein n=1 Tax=Thermopolyspora flexuosa TaxID=103836 RepID=A0A543IZJ7_9ACTN|nr:hypothetical protein FHX40_2724 [Thermopolyspora flexuosa]
MRHVRDVLVTAIILALLGAGAGLIWSAVAPPTRYVVGADGPRLADPSTQTLIAADGLFAVITAGAGLVCGILAFAFARRPAVLLGLAAGGVAAGLIAERVGGSAGTTVLRAAEAGGFQEGSRLAVTAQGVLLAWPLFAVAAFGLLEAIAAYLGSEYRRAVRGHRIADLSDGMVVPEPRRLSRRARPAWRSVGRHARTRGRGGAPPCPPRDGRSPGRRRAGPAE